MKAIKLVGIDLDGTLVMEDGTVSVRNIDAVRRAGDCDVTVAIVTGRPHVSAEQFVAGLGLEHTPLISFNGAMIRMPSEREPLAEWPIPADLASELVRYFIDHKYHIHYYLGDVMYVTRVSHWARLYRERTGVEPAPAGDMRRFDGEEPIKMLVCVPPGERDDVVSDSRRQFGDDINVTPSMPEYVEYLSKDASKGRALSWLAEYLEVPMDATAGIGDRGNDLDLLTTSELGIAMQQAEGEVKAAAEYITKSQSEGVAEALEKFVLSGRQRLEQ